MQAAPPISAELEQSLSAYSAPVRRFALALRLLVRSEAPDATELLYDSYNAVSIAFTYNGRLGGAFCHVAVYSGHVNLGFNRGSELPDPEGLLRGSGKWIRHLKVRRVEDLEQPYLREFIRLAALHAPPAEGAECQARSVTRTVSARKRGPA